MPPKAKFTREQITEAALQLVRDRGVGALTARGLAEKLECSPRPIFTVFQNMEEVREAAAAEARAVYAEYAARGLEDPQPFKGVGTQYILFALREPRLFQLLFMQPRNSVSQEAGTLSGVLSMLDDCYGKILLSIERSYGIDEVSAMKLYHHLWIYCHGIAALCATRMCRFTGREISVMLSEVVNSLLTQLKPAE